MCPIETAREPSRNPERVDAGSGGAGSARAVGEAFETARDFWHFRGTVRRALGSQPRGDACLGGRAGESRSQAFSTFWLAAWHRGRHGKRGTRSASTREQDAGVFGTFAVVRAVRRARKRQRGCRRMRDTRYPGPRVCCWHEHRAPHLCCLRPLRAAKRAPTPRPFRRARPAGFPPPGLVRTPDSRRRPASVPAPRSRCAGRHGVTA